MIDHDLVSKINKVLNDVQQEIIKAKMKHPRWAASAHERLVPAVLLLSQTRAFGIQRDLTMTMMDWLNFEDGRLALAKNFLRSQMMSVISSPFAAQAEPNP